VPERGDRTVSDDPVLDGRDREAILSWTKAIAPYYVDGWDPSREDAGTALLNVFADITEDIVDSLDRIPEQQQAVFLDELDFDPLPPQPSKLPVTFEVTEGATENVAVPLGTTTTAPATDERDEQGFETVGDRKFEATPATLTDVLGVDPGVDRIVDHGSGLDAGERTELFTGENLQQHAYYLGHAELLTLNPGATIEVEVTTNAPTTAFRDYVTWEYYGETEDGEEGWHELTVVDRQESATGSLSDVQQVESFVDRVEPILQSEGYRLIDDEAEYRELMRALADDVRKRRYGAEGSTAEFELPGNLIADPDVDDLVFDRLRHRLIGLTGQLRSMAADNRLGDTLDPITLSLEIPGEVTEREIDGIESRWIRARIPSDELAHPLFNTLVSSARISVGAGAAVAADEETDADESEGDETESDDGNGNAGLGLDDAIANDVVLDVDGPEPLSLFGANPAEEATFVFACREAFTKPGASVTMSFASDEPDDYEPDDADPEIVWEYWNGTGWRRLSVEDDTDELRADGSVSFEVPSDIDTVVQLGQERHWLRVRLVSGNYGQLRMEETESGSWEQVRDHIRPPEYDEIRVEYEQSEVPFRHQLAENNLSTEAIDPECNEFRPFHPPSEHDSQAVYLGFDQQLSGGPMQLYLPMSRAVYPETFTPWMDMEYCMDPTCGEWVRLDLHDDTADLTEEGILSFSLPEPTESFEAFGRDRHWLRIRISGEEFARSDGTLFVPYDRTSTRTSLRELSDESIASREQSDQTRTPPVLTGMHLNTTWARNIERIEAETLGSSSGTGDQTLQFEIKPVLDAEVWVDELAALSRRERELLEDDSETTVEAETDDDGTVSAFWVRWTRVDDFLNSDAEARHYKLNHIDGTVTFGDGRNGRIPVAGENNVRADYRTGGGDDGDVAVGAVENLDDDIPLVDSVTNPGPGETGEPEEPLPEFFSRAPKQLRDRNKPVTRDGFERIALSAAREIEKVQCRAGEEETGKIGQVTLLIVPDVAQRKPVPSEKLVEQVEKEMEANAPEAVVGDNPMLTVRGPNYVEVSISATVETAGVRSTTEVQEAAKTALTDFIHPLTGGPDGDGWEIGHAPAPTVFTAHLERLDSVSRVTSITVTYTEGDDEVILVGGAGEPIVPLDVLIYSGHHDITVNVGGEQ
jgi:hypothetical protein